MCMHATACIWRSENNLLERFFPCTIGSHLLNTGPSTGIFVHWAIHICGPESLMFWVVFISDIRLYLGYLCLCTWTGTPVNTPPSLFPVFFFFLCWELNAGGSCVCEASALPLSYISVLCCVYFCILFLNVLLICPQISLSHPLPCLSKIAACHPSFYNINHPFQFFGIFINSWKSLRMYSICQLYIICDI